jgi:hypothetical protein
MHAVFISVTFNDRSAAEAELPALVSQVKGVPDFVAGYWVATSADKGTAIVVFESEESANTQAANARTAEGLTVTMDSIEVGRVLAHA